MLTYENTQFVISILTFAGIMFAIYKFFRDPDIKAKYAIRQINETCRMKHKHLDKAVESNANDLKLIKENHITHIENDVSQIKQDLIRVLTILEEREYAPKKRC